MTLNDPNPDFKVTTLFDAEDLGNYWMWMGTSCKAFWKHRMLFLSMQFLAWLAQGRTQGETKMGVFDFNFTVKARREGLSASAELLVFTGTSKGGANLSHSRHFQCSVSVRQG